ncbi:MAG: 30S ribosomal protein S19 [candidate division TM6 bacterium GW2011_GWF2_28_16]|jgi:small subunit ribosomal protein S19|nr:MAG: 30S ribosomal protein S19 [candidate division TM6 bacterium GW2011_GWF2_28_16]
MARSTKKGPYVDPTLLEKIEAAKEAGSRQAIKTWKRNSVIIPDMVGLTIAVHDGRKFISVFVTENMVGHRLGEFAPSRTFRMHSGQRKTAAPEAAPAPAAKK